METKMIKIEKTTPQGYSIVEVTVNEAYNILNQDIENGQTIFIDGRPFLNQIIGLDDISKCKKEISVTPKLSGG